MTNKEKAIVEILNQWFELKVVKAEEIKFNYVINDNKMRKQCEWLRKEYYPFKAKQTFIVDYILEIYLAMRNFRATESEWLAMVQNEENSRLSELNLLSRSYAQYEIKRSKIEQNGQIMSVENKEVLVTLPTFSLDFIGEKDNDEVNLYNFLTSDSSLFYKSNNQDFYQTGFREWFDENREKILTKNQNEFLANMNKVNMQEHDNETVRALVGIEKCKVNTKLDAIAERVLKAYNKQLPAINNYSQQAIKGRIELLEPIINMIYSDNLDEDASPLIYFYVSAFYEELQEYCQLKTCENQALNRGEYDNKIVYKLVQQLEEKYESLSEQLAKNDKVKSETVDEFVSFRRKKAAHDSDEMDIHLIVGKDGFIIKQKIKEDPFDQPEAGEMRVYIAV